MRVPGTNPFCFDNDAHMGNRFLALLDTVPDVEVYVMNTGRVGGHEADERSKKVKIRHSSAVVKGIVEGSIRWEEDPDFGYFVATELADVEDADLLNPKAMYASQGRADEYAGLVAKLLSDRRAYLRTFPGLDPSIVEAI